MKSVTVTVSVTQLHSRYCHLLILFSALTVLVGWQEGLPVCKILPPTPKVLLWDVFGGTGLTWSDLRKNRLIKQ